MGRAPCCDKGGLKKGPWTPEEDQILINYIQTHGPGNWRTFPTNAGLQRCGKSCRLRWTNYLRPDIKRGRFSFEEEETIIQLHSVLGNKWSAIAARLPGRTDNEIKNYWNTHIRKRMLKMGIDPVTHAPRLDLLDLSSVLSLAMHNPTFFSMSNLLGTQSFINPELLKLVSSLLSLKSANPELVAQHLQQSQLGSMSQLQSQFPVLQNNHLFLQTLTDHHVNVEGLSSNLTDFSSQRSILPENPMPSYFPDHTFVTQPNFVELQGAPCSQPQNNNTLQNLSYDSVLSTPVSSPTPLNSSSTCINANTEDERDSNCSDLFKFEIPGSFDISEFL